MEFVGRHLASGNYNFVLAALDAPIPALRGRDGRGWTLLHHAVWIDTPCHVVAKMIDSLGLSPNDKDGRGNTAMHDAGFQDVSPELVKLLLEKGGDPNQENLFGETAVYEASYRSGAAVMKVLLESGGNPDVITSDRGTPLLAAVTTRNCLEVISLLLKHGANQKNKDYSNRSPSDIAREMKYHDAERLMERVSVCVAIFSITIERLGKETTLRMLTPDLLRKVGDYL